MAGDSGRWGTIMAVQLTHKNFHDPITHFKVGTYTGSNVRGGPGGFLNVAVVFGPKREVSLARVAFMSAYTTSCSHI